MMIISFAWTTPALLAGAKTVTRRSWSPGYARRFKKYDLVAAYDRSPRYGGKRVATIRLTQDPYRENTADMTDQDYEAEGLAWMERNMIPVKTRPLLYAGDFWDQWRNAAEFVWVVRFEVLPRLERGA